MKPNIVSSHLWLTKPKEAQPKNKWKKKKVLPAAGKENLEVISKARLLLKRGRMGYFI